MNREPYTNCDVYAFIGSIMTSDGYSHFWNVESTRTKVSHCDFCSVYFPILRQIELDANPHDFIFELDDLVNNTNV